jgi:hypothetical protein
MLAAVWYIASKFQHSAKPELRGDYTSGGYMKIGRRC